MHETSEVGVRDIMVEEVRKGQAQQGRDILRRILERRVGQLPAALSRQIDAIDDPERLTSAIDEAVSANSFDDVQL